MCLGGFLENPFGAFGQTLWRRRLTKQHGHPRGGRYHPTREGRASGTWAQPLKGWRTLRTEDRKVASHAAGLHRKEYGRTETTVVCLNKHPQTPQNHQNNPGKPSKPNIDSPDQDVHFFRPKTAKNEDYTRSVKQECADATHAHWTSCRLLKPVKPPETFVTANTIVSLIFNIIYTVDHLGLWTQTLEGGLQVVAQVDHLGLWTQTLEGGLQVVAQVDHLGLWTQTLESGL
ncbi:hypothetical protein Bbelb_364080 [Branchiostoma belcheri]|nr:hypothetical protein Bbelb_364080 [Branchiostoma belcheri]